MVKLILGGGFAVLILIAFIAMKIGKGLEKRKARRVLEALRTGGRAAGRAALDAAYPPARGPGKMSRPRIALLGTIDVAALEQEVAAIGTKGWRAAYDSLFGAIAIGTFSSNGEEAASKAKAIAAEYGPKAGQVGARVYSLATLVAATQTGHVASVSVSELAKTVIGEASLQALLYHALAKAHLRAGQAAAAQGLRAQADAILPMPVAA